MKRNSMNRAKFTGLILTAAIASGLMGGNVCAKDNTEDTGSINISGSSSRGYDSTEVKLTWTTDTRGGEFEIYYSEDGEEYSPIKTLGRNARSYTYYTEDYRSIYFFKIKQTSGDKWGETEILMAVDPDEYVDSDNDDLCDWEEVYRYNTDPTNPDTDGDGLPDGFEVYTMDSDPAKYDSYGRGLSDGEYDRDEDGLTNIREYELGTSARNKDTDRDGLTDGEEVDIYGTDPLNEDTDGDGVADKDEIALGLDPLKAVTDGIPDSERTFAQTVHEDDWSFYTINRGSDPFCFSVDITAAGVAKENMEGTFSGYEYAMNNDCILGCGVDIEYPEELKIDEIILNFDIKKDVREGGDKQRSELRGIKRFNVFKLCYPNLLLPMETFHDEKAGRVCAVTDECGVYCLIDMAAWLESIGYSKGEGILYAHGLTRLPEDLKDFSTESDADYDGDGLADIEEINLKAEDISGRPLIRVTDSGDIILPGFNEYISRMGAAKGLERFYRTGAISPSGFNGIKVLPIYCDPAREDSDGDGISDYEEMNNRR